MKIAFTEQSKERFAALDNLARHIAFIIKIEASAVLVEILQIKCKKDHRLTLHGKVHNNGGIIGN